MSTLQDRIQDYCGTISDTAQLTDVLTAGAKVIVNAIPEEKLDLYSAAITDSGSGATVSGHRLVRAHKSGYTARRVDAGLKSQVALATSMHKATTTSPVWYVENGSGYVLPSGGTIIGVAYPTVLYSDSSISSFPTEWIHGVVLYGVIQVLLSKSNVAYDALNALTMDTVNAPSAPADASFTYTDATLGTYTSTSIGSFGTAPTYTKPTCSLTASPSDLTISSTAPTAPTVPVFVYTDATLGTYTSTVVGDLGTIPTYIKPTISMTTAPSALSLSSITLPSAPADLTLSAVAPTSPTIASVTYSDGTGGTFTQTTIGAFPTAPVYTKPVSSFATTSATTYIATDEDLDKASVEINKQTTLLDQHGKDLYNELNKFNGELESYKLDVQKVLKQAELDQERLIREALDDTQLSLQNEAQTTLAIVSNNRSLIEKYLGDINLYQAKVNAEVSAYQSNVQKYSTALQGSKTDIEKQVSEYRANLEAWQTKRQTELSQFQADISNELNKFNKDLSIYQSTVQKAITDAQLAQQRILQTASDTMNLSLQNESQTLVQQIQEYQAKLSKYADDINLYSQNINKEVQQYQTNLQKWTVDRQTQLGLYSNDIQNELNEFNKENVEYQGVIQKAITQAQLDQERLMLAASKTTDLSIQNKAKDLEKQISQYQALLSKYQGQIAEYGSSVQKAVSKYSTGIQKYMGLISANDSLINQCRTEFKTILSLI
jgi:chromosome segregation ATPase